MTSTSHRLSSGSTVALGMMGMNVAIYGFTVAAARSLVPAELGALVALLGILLMGNVVSLGIQAVTARRIAVAPDDRADVVGVVVRVTAAAALAVGAVVALLSVVLVPLLRLDSPWPIILAGLTLVPLTVMGAQAGVAQGSERWGSLTAIYLANGLGRLVLGTAAILVEPSATSAMVGIALGAWVPVLVGAPLLRGHVLHPHGISRRPLVREAVLGSHALLAYFVLSSLDALVARNRFEAHEAGLYAAGLILSKAALFAPQFVSVVLFPDLARDETRRARNQAVLAVAGLGALAVVATALLPRLALVLVGGERYDEIAGRLWLFALAGSCLAVVHLLVFDALARHAHGVVVLVWAGAAVVVGVAYGLDVHLTGLVTTVASVSAVLAVIVWFVPGRTTAQEH
ncbi:lipopolysaccharide biosynthesis protein [Aeromicrobium sp. 50.2.37]|uniref:lipopolysaccharide biosynthesis protein n=1 Tax=Aeromicrobium sp. 50.2.37 TaxID=2969305 RepID=UPI0021502178|nr:polysaccharide biosynthesis protein [Aeromicrobium sp. 50.2.37]MCR4512312.1 polysaccharide biosynthesis protein [Aeromicrobium sp. 50.2.37]